MRYRDSNNDSIKIIGYYSSQASCNASHASSQAAEDNVCANIVCVCMFVCVDRRTLRSEFQLDEASVDLLEGSHQKRLMTMLQRAK